ncbi:16S rRNA (cytosine(967)-C(5))-methyltransferase RsmB [Amnimonas aquatica]|uniref:16S rRNA (cytosine(967)-C(5))-methyltransferase n=1 Tax=Amnimonas aquatica TaxID=2094561 RepID=A0A2P6ASA7_9GAMM|nr:16S rRNA (cytosine(967)-C(5))-methyltransferase RsmB [Amnimonas aquatica]PQA42364.1 16S rRNA (cytosine(967)-C(5))-methyltransferase [Amnimonas aquatica]
MSSLNAKRHDNIRKPGQQGGRNAGNGQGRSPRGQLGVRALAARALAPVLAGSASLSATLPAAQRACRGEDIGLLQELVQGTARSAIHYRTLIKPLLQRAQKDTLVEALLLLGTHQLLAMRIPDHAALAETVEAARQLGLDKLTGFINGVLRNLQRREEELVAAARIQEHAHPAWLLRQLRQDWPDQADDIIAANNSPSPLTLRVHRGRATREAVLAAWIDDGLPVEPTRHAPDGLRLTEPVPVLSLPGLADGLVSVQDEAAQLAACLLAPQPGERVLDACAAPGGKTAHLLEIQPALAALTALDNDADRLKRVAENLARAGYAATPAAGEAPADTATADTGTSASPDITLRCAPAEQTDSWWDGQAFDAILLDAPCSATGVIRRHPDIKLLRRPTDIAQTVRIQAELLDRLWRTLKPGGRLLYATCSVLKAENEDQITAFLGRTADARATPLRFDGEMPGQWRPQGRQLLPEIDGHDGFYFALLEKTA